MPKFTLPLVRLTGHESRTPSCVVTHDRVNSLTYPRNNSRFRLRSVLTGETGVEGHETERGRGETGPVGRTIRSVCDGTCDDGMLRDTCDGRDDREGWATGVVRMWVA